jgi:hypothetical protein
MAKPEMWVLSPAPGGRCTPHDKTRKQGDPTCILNDLPLYALCVDYPLDRANGTAQ